MNGWAGTRAEREWLGAIRRLGANVELLAGATERVAAATERAVEMLNEVAPVLERPEEEGDA